MHTQPPPTPTRSSLFWRLQTTGWCGFALLLMTMAGASSYFSLQHSLLLILLRCGLGFLITCGLRPLWRRLRHATGHTWFKGALVFFGCGLAAILEHALNIQLAQLTRNELFLGPDARFFFLISPVVRWMLFWLWSVLYFSINYWLDTKDTPLRLARAEAEARAAELELLKAQVNPHFLFNALNSILAESSRPESVRNLTHALAAYLRFSLRQTTPFARLGVELDALSYYLKVEKTRFEESLDYTLEADAQARDALAPVALVQPLLENAIKYGQHAPIRPLRITIAAKVENGWLHLTVRNTGHWVEARGLATTGTGLANLRRRLDLLYGPRATLHTGEAGGEVTIQVTIPLQPL